MSLKDHGKLMLVTLGWFTTGLTVLISSVCMYKYLTGLFLMTRLRDMSIPELLSLLLRVERMVKIMMVVTIVSIILYVFNYLYALNNYVDISDVQL